MTRSVLRGSVTAVRPVARREATGQSLHRRRCPRGRDDRWRSHSTSETRSRSSPPPPSAYREGHETGIPVAGMGARLSRLRGVGAVRLHAPPALHGRPVRGDPVRARRRPASSRVPLVRPGAPHAFGFSSPLITLCCAAWATGRMLTCSMLMWCGSSSAPTIASAMSSAVERLLHVLVDLRGPPRRRRGSA